MSAVYRCFVLAAFMPLALLTLSRVGSVRSATSSAGRIVRLDPRFDRLVPTDAKLEQIARGFHWVEGPVWNRKDHCLLFSDIPANSIFKWQEVSPRTSSELKAVTAKPWGWSPAAMQEESAGISLFLKPSGYTGRTPFAGREPGSNGLAFDSVGRLVLCEHGDRRVARLEVDGRKTTLADRFQGKRLNSPNDLVFASNGDLYFTDPPFGLPGGFEDPEKELGFSGVYRLSSDGRLTALIRDLRAPNGIALSPSGKTLYVSNADREHAVWMRFDLGQDGSTGGGSIFFDATAWTKDRPGAPDGIKVDQEGNLFAAGPGGIHVFAPDGSHLGSIDLGVPTSNCAWGNDGSVLYITADTAVYRIRLRTRGLGFHGTEIGINGKQRPRPRP